MLFDDIHHVGSSFHLVSRTRESAALECLTRCLLDSSSSSSIPVSSSSSSSLYMYILLMIQSVTVYIHTYDIVYINIGPVSNACYRQQFSCVLFNKSPSLIHQHVIFHTRPVYYYYTITTTTCKYSN